MGGGPNPRGGPSPLGGPSVPPGRLRAYGEEPPRPEAVYPRGPERPASGGTPRTPPGTPALNGCPPGGTPPAQPLGWRRPRGAWPSGGPLPAPPPRPKGPLLGPPTGWPTPRMPPLAPAAGVPQDAAANAHCKPGNQASHSLSATSRCNWFSRVNRNPSSARRAARTRAAQERPPRPLTVCPIPSLSSCLLSSVRIGIPS